MSAPVWPTGPSNDYWQVGGGYFEITGEKYVSPFQSKVKGAVSVIFRDKDDNSIIDWDLWSQKSRALMPGSNFIIDEVGARSATLTFNDIRFKDIPLLSRVEIYLDNQEIAWSGFVAIAPDENQTSEVVEFTCRGYAAQLTQGCLNIKPTPGMVVWELVKYLVESVMTDDTKIKFEDCLIDRSADWPCDGVRFIGTNYDEAFAQLALLAGDYVYGIDSADRFYFCKRKEFAKVDGGSIWHKGYEFEEFSGSLDSSSLVNVALVKFTGWADDGEPVAVGDLRLGGYLDQVLVDAESRDKYGIHCGILTAPSQLSPVDTYRHSSNELARLAHPKRTISINGLVYDGDRVKVPGLACLFLDKRGNDWDEGIEVYKKRVRYRLNESYITMEVELDNVPASAVSIISDLKTQRARSELAERTASERV